MFQPLGFNILGPWILKRVAGLVPMDTSYKKGDDRGQDFGKPGDQRESESYQWHRPFIAKSATILLGCIVCVTVKVCTEFDPPHT